MVVGFRTSQFNGIGPRLYIYTYVQPVINSKFRALNTFIPLLPRALSTSSPLQRILAYFFFAYLQPPKTTPSTSAVKSLH
jgi:hypothetical protein